MHLILIISEKRNRLSSTLFMDGKWLLKISRARFLIQSGLSRTENVTNHSREVVVIVQCIDTREMLPSVSSEPCHHEPVSVPESPGQRRHHTAVHPGAPGQVRGGVEAWGRGDHGGQHDGQPRHQVQSDRRLQPEAGEPAAARPGHLHLPHLHPECSRHPDTQPGDPR